MAAAQTGLTFRSEPDDAHMQRLASAANAFDFATLGVWDDLGDHSPWPMLSALARPPGSARIGPSCLALPKYAALDGIVSEITRLNQLRPGRVLLGLTGGAWLERVGLRRATPARMREAVAALRYLLARRTEGLSGRLYRLAPGFALNFETPRDAIPILIGAWGENMAALAGEIADEVKIGGSANPLMVSIMRERLAVGAGRAGRRAEDVGVVLGAVTVVDEDREAALRRLRPRAALYVDVIGANDPTAVHDFPEELAAIQAAVRKGDMDEALRNLPDGLLHRFAFAGTPADVIHQAEAAFAAGATRVEFGSPHGIDDLQGIELLGKRVLPYFSEV